MYASVSMEHLVGGRQKLAVSLALAGVFLLALWRLPLAIPVAIALVAAYDIAVAFRHRRAGWLLTTLLALVFVGAVGMMQVLQSSGGRWLFFGLALAVALTDASAQVTGRRFGRPGTFLPRFSPSKSSAGVLWSWGIMTPLVVGTAVVLLAFRPEVPLWYLIGLVLAPMVSTFGDIFESAVKRAVGIKDFGSYLGGSTGGLMDRVDSWVAAFAVTFVASSLLG